jgi:hypothetical protein
MPSIHPASTPEADYASFFASVSPNTESEAAFRACVPGLRAGDAELATPAPLDEGQALRLLFHTPDAPDLRAEWCNATEEVNTTRLHAHSPLDRCGFYGYLIQQVDVLYRWMSSQKKMPRPPRAWVPQKKYVLAFLLRPCHQCERACVYLTPHCFILPRKRSWMVMGCLY